MNGMEADRANLIDVQAARGALERAEASLKALLDGTSRNKMKDHELFVFETGFARGHLSRVSDRIYAAGENAS